MMSAARTPMTAPHLFYEFAVVFTHAADVLTPRRCRRAMPPFDGERRFSRRLIFAPRCHADDVPPRCRYAMPPPCSHATSQQAFLRDFTRTLCLLPQRRQRYLCRLCRMPARAAARAAASIDDAAASAARHATLLLSSRRRDVAADARVCVADAPRRLTPRIFADTPPPRRDVADAAIISRYYCFISPPPPPLAAICRRCARTRRHADSRCRRAVYATRISLRYERMRRRGRDAAADYVFDAPRRADTSRLITAPTDVIAPL